MTLYLYHPFHGCSELSAGITVIMIDGVEYIVRSIYTNSDEYVINFGTEHKYEVFELCIYKSMAYKIHYKQ